MVKNYYNYASQQSNIFSNSKFKFLRDNARSINNALKGVLFMETFRNLAWSRGYSWYVELDGVPNPFQRGGVIGLPVVDISFQIVNGETFDWNTSVENFSVPKSRSLCTVNLTVLDDEQATMFQFFERWWNNVYNSYLGVLPLSEACKCLSIMKLKSTRTNVPRQVERYNLGGEGAKTQRITFDSRDLIVFPTEAIEENEKNDTSQPRTYTVRLGIASQDNSDYGNPKIHSTGSFSLFGKTFDVTDSNIWGRIADYI